MLKSLKQQLFKKRDAVFKRFFHYAITNISLKAVGFVSLPILTRIFTIEEYGIYSTYITVVSILVTVLGLNLPQAVQRYFYEKEKTDFQEFINSIFYFLLASSAVIFIFYLLFKDYVLKLFNISNEIFIAALLSSLGVAALNILFKKSVAEGKSAVVARLSMINNIGTLSVALGTTFLLLPISIYTFVWAGTGFKIFFFFLVLYYLNIHKGKVTIARDHLKYAFVYALPRWFFTASILLLNQFDKLMINSISGSESTAIYSVAYNIGMLVTLFISAVTPAITPNYYKNLDEGNFKEIDRLNLVFSLSTLLLCMLLLFMSPYLIGILVPGKYGGAKSIIPIIILGYAIHSFSSIYGRIFDYVKSAKYLSYTATFAFIVNIVLNYFWIHQFGYTGAAYATTISFFIMLMLLWYFSKQHVKVHTTDIRIFILPFIMFLAVVLVSANIDFKPIYHIIFAVGSLAICSLTFYKYYVALQRKGIF